MTDVTRPCEPDAKISAIDARQREFNMPASWEDMLALGLDPLTGERT